MLTINLLPSEEKRIVRTEVIGRAVRFFASAVVAIVIVGVILLFPSFLPMAFERRELTRSLALSQAAAQSEEDRAVAVEVRALDRNVALVRGVVSRVPPTPLVLAGLSQSSVNGIAVTNLTVKESREFSISGVATDRRTLLVYEKTLRSSGIIDTLDFPISNIIPETNIHFALRGTLKNGFGF